MRNRLQFILRIDGHRSEGILARPRVMFLGVCVLGIIVACCIHYIYDVPHKPSHASSVPPTELRVSLTSDTVSAGAPLTFHDIALPFRYEGGKSGKALPVEPVGGGVAVADLDGDGRLDLFFAQGISLSDLAVAHAGTDVLLRNGGEHNFEDVSSAACLIGTGYGMGATAADIDEDGFVDVYVTRYGANTLWHNQGDGSFRDITGNAHVGSSDWGIGAAFADIDRDGDLDLFVANYFYFDPALAPFARDPVTGAAEFGAPASFEGLPDVLYRNDGDGQFTDITESAGVRESNRGMGVLAADFDGDGWIDFLVANDAQTNALWRNLGNGRFQEVSLAWGIAFNADGKAEANMGIAYGDTDGDAMPDVLISHLVTEHDTLWRSRVDSGGDTYFHDETLAAGLATDSLKFTGWGTALVDFDHDGWLDLVVANGHIRQEPFQEYVFRNPPLLCRNRGDGRFANVSAHAGSYFGSLHQARGLAAGDLDGDLDVDLAIVQHDESSVVLWNESPKNGPALVVQLVGERSSRDAIGARVCVRVNGRVLIRSVDGGSSYASCHDRRLHFGLGDADRVDWLEVIWPSGVRQSWSGVTVDKSIILRETQNAVRAVGD